MNLSSSPNANIPRFPKLTFPFTKPKTCPRFPLSFLSNEINLFERTFRSPFNGSPSTLNVATRYLHTLLQLLMTHVSFKKKKKGYVASSPTPCKLFFQPYQTIFHSFSYGISLLVYGIMVHYVYHIYTCHDTFSHFSSNVP